MTSLPAHDQTMPTNDKKNLFFFIFYFGFNPRTVFFYRSRPPATALWSMLEAVAIAFFHGVQIIVIKHDINLPLRWRKLYLDPPCDYRLLLGVRENS